MPIYEFQCRKCGEVFEQLFFPSDKTRGIVCPSCGAEDPCKLMSAFSCSASAEGSAASEAASCAPRGGFS